MQTNIFPHKEWWESKDAPDRFCLMKKYNLKEVSDKLIKKMYLKENIKQ